jgi:hypothetical protein
MNDITDDLHVAATFADGQMNNDAEVMRNAATEITRLRGLLREARQELAGLSDFGESLSRECYDNAHAIIGRIDAAINNTPTE